VTEQHLGNERTSIVANGAELRIERTFDAPRELVWRAWTEPEHVANWWGPHGTTARVVEMDVRPGGRWKWIANATADSGGTATFAGEYLEVDPPERFVRTALPDPAPPGPPAVETVTFTEIDGKTTMRYHATFPSEETLNFAISLGMTKGVLDQYDRMADLLASGV
jgi:uncharacterized protein YndB with AHSA1/START domain